MRITLSDQKFLPLFDTIIETHLMNTFNVMPNYLTVSNNTILVRVLDTGIKNRTQCLRTNQRNTGKLYDKAYGKDRCRYPIYIS